MPLITFTGYPKSGKTRRVEQLATYLRERATQGDATISVVVVSEARTAHSYDNQAEEKKMRGLVISEVERRLGKETVVIVDGLNYIKGFRYQLHCLAKNLKTTACTVQCGVPVDVARGWNAACVQQEGSASMPYEPQIFDELIMRYEEPNGRNRWDSPLFTIAHTDEALPLDDIWAALFPTKHASKKK